jgi:hypothetical protein
LSDCLGEANVDRIGDLESFWIAAAFDSSPKDSGRFVGDVEPSDGGTDMMIGVLAWKADSSTTQQIAGCVLELAESNESA